MNEIRPKPRDENTGSPAPQETASAFGYSPPKLKIYGTVVEFTKGVRTNKSDAGPRKQNLSDINLKQNIVKIGDHTLGFGLYLYDYKPPFCDTVGQDRQFGVMAQEVEQFVPEAVSITSDGYRQVDYAMLGIVRH